MTLLTGPERRRRWDDDVREQILAEAFSPGAIVADGDLMECLWHDGLGLSLYAKRLDRGRFIWPVAITPAQMGYLLEAIDWRNPQQTWRPTNAGQTKNLPASAFWGPQSGRFMIPLRSWMQLWTPFPTMWRR